MSIPDLGDALTETIALTMLWGAADTVGLHGERQGFDRLVSVAKEVKEAIERGMPPKEDVAEALREGEQQ